MKTFKTLKYASIIIFIFTIGFVFYNSSQISLGQDDPAEEVIDYEYSAVKCPINVSEIIQSPFLENDFTEFNQDEYLDYVESFQQEAYSSVISEMTTYYSDSYSTTLQGPLDDEIMKYIVKSHDSAYIAGENISLRMDISEEISNCIDKKLQIVLAVEKSILNSEYQTFVSQSVLAMMTSIQNDLNYYREEILEPQIETYADQATSFPYKP